MDQLPHQLDQAEKPKVLADMVWLIDLREEDVAAAARKVTRNTDHQ